MLPESRKLLEDIRDAASHIDAFVRGKSLENLMNDDFRNQIIHGYSLIDDMITWDVIQEKLPTLLRETEELLKIAGA